MSKSLLQKSLGENLLKATRLTVKSPLRNFSRFFTRSLSSFSLSQRPSNASRTVQAARAVKASAPELQLKNAAAKPDAPRPHWTDPLVDAITTPLVELAPTRPVAAPAVTASTPEHSDHPQPDETAGPQGQSIEAELLVAAPVAAEITEAIEARPGIFSEAVFEFDGQSYPFRLYVPAARAPQITKESGLPDSSTTLNAAAAAEAAPPESAALPLIVLLHGCKQNALDFAQGTAMNELADANQCMVLYPEQLQRANSGRCWNWFEPAHQQRDQGEPGMIAALTQQVLGAEHEGRCADPQRAYIAGLSAGGAMSAVVADLYPDIFAAVGVHSGLPAGAANGMMAAFGAMSRGAKGQAATPLPTIVFHGTADRTVHPDNGANVSDAALTALRASGLALVKSSRKPARSRAEPLSTSTAKTIYRATNGPSYIEHWKVEEGPHAWSGGNAEGSYTDPDGPSASAAMLAFFLQHKRAGTPLKP